MPDFIRSDRASRSSSLRAPGRRTGARFGGRRLKPFLRHAAVAGLVGLSAAACGRRGALEPPQVVAPAAAAPAQGQGTAVGARTLPVDVGLGGGAPEPNPDAVRAGDELSIAAVPPAGTEAPVETGRGAKRGYRIPREPFILDPLL